MAKITPADTLSNSGAVEDVLTDLQNDLNAHFRKKCGVDIAMRLDDPSSFSNVSCWVSSRSIVVDSVLRGGRPLGSSLVPFGRQMEISGPEGVGKTTLCAHIAAETQSKGGIVLFNETEDRLDELYWRTLGVNTNRIVKLRCESIEDAFNVQYRAIQKAREKFPEIPVLLIWDSLGGTQGVDLDIETEGKNGLEPMKAAEKYAMRMAKKIADGMVLINQEIAKTRVCYLYTNHEYTKMNVSYGSNRETRGGNKPKYLATVRLQLTNVGNIVEEDEKRGITTVVGQKVRVKALKNSMAGLLKTMDAVILAGRGFVNEYTVFDIAATSGFITKSGSWSTWKPQTGGEVKFQGFSGFVENVVPHPEYPLLFDAVVSSL